MSDLRRAKQTKGLVKAVELVGWIALLAAGQQTQKYYQFVPSGCAKFMVPRKERQTARASRDSQVGKVSRRNQ